MHMLSSKFEDCAVVESLEEKKRRIDFSVFYVKHPLSPRLSLHLHLLSCSPFPSNVACDPSAFSITLPF